jgi:hypothetical protein
VRLRCVCAPGACKPAANPLCADYYCVQSQLFNHATMNVMHQSRLLWRHTKRISD